MVVLGFGSKVGQIKHIKIGFHSYRLYSESYKHNSTAIVLWILSILYH